VTAIVVTRGDVDLKPVAASLPKAWELLVWNNELATALRWSPDGSFAMIPAADLSVYGRYAAIEFASHDLIYVQDDDVIVSDPELIVRQYCSGESYDATDKFRLFPDSNSSYKEALWNDGGEHDREYVICNMPEEFRPHYTDSALVGFGACFHRSLPETVFDRWRLAGADNWVDAPTFRRCCDVVLTTLAPRVLVDVPKENREMASDPNRMWKQPGHVSERATVLNLARSVRDA